MALKWNKKICIQYIQELRSPLEESAGFSGDGNKPKLSQIADRLRQIVAKRPLGE